MIPVFQFDEVTSTQDVAFVKASQEKVSPPFAVYARHQTAGRGRMNREWVSEFKKSFALSVVVEVPVQRMMGLSLVAGLAIRAGVGIEALQLKWPNDLMLKNQKVGGILIESKSVGARQFVFIGVGLNIFDLSGASFKGLNKKLDAEALTQVLVDYVGRFRDEGFSAFRENYLKAMWGLHEERLFNSGDGAHSVVISGVDEQGQLITRAGDVISLNISGEIEFGER